MLLSLSVRLTDSPDHWQTPSGNASCRRCQTDGQGRRSHDAASVARTAQIRQGRHKFKREWISCGRHIHLVGLGIIVGTAACDERNDACNGVYAVLRPASCSVSLSSVSLIRSCLCRVHVTCRPFIMCFLFSILPLICCRCSSPVCDGMGGVLALAFVACSYPSPPLLVLQRVKQLFRKSLSFPKSYKGNRFLLSVSLCIVSLRPV